jgi:hypothetical protein
MLLLSSGLKGAETLQIGRRLAGFLVVVVGKAAEERARVTL